MSSLPPAKYVLVVGDPILDRRIEGAMTRISPEAPVPIVQQQSVSEQPGGAANVARNIWTLGGSTRFAGLLGQDPAGEAMSRLMQNDLPGIITCLSPCNFLRTSVKTRIVVAGQQVLRLDEDSVVVPGSYCVEFLRSLGNVFQPNTDVGLIVISDYNKGGVSETVRQFLRDASQMFQIPMFVDAKPAVLERYRGVSLVKINRREAVESAKNFGYIHPGLLLPDEQAEIAADFLRQYLGVETVIVTCGGDATCVAGVGGTVQYPTATDGAVDVTGAGDVFLAGLSVAFLEGRSIVDSVYFANTAAGLSVQASGTVGVQRDAVEDALLQRLGWPAKVMSLEAAEAFVRRRRAADETVVLANGCFDALHAGHLSALHYAKGCGDVLVVAYNDDASVRSLKGEGRPLTAQTARGNYLALCEIVDCVTVFDGDVEALVRRLKPDVLVKGAEYRSTRVPGADYLAGRGGEVLFAPMVPGISTTMLSVPPASP